MTNFIFGDSAPLKDQLARYLSAQRAHYFHGTRPHASIRFAEDTNLEQNQMEHFEKGTTIKSLHLHTLHAALSAQRTAWATIQTMSSALEMDFKEEFGEEAMTFFTMLAADPPGGSIDNVTHEHVANIIALLKRKTLADTIDPAADHK